MPLPHLAGQQRAFEGQDVVLIPLRSLRNGKHRLAEIFSAQQREAAIRIMAERVITAAHDLPVLVVHADADVGVWAERRGAASLRPTSPGLNQAVTAGRDMLAGAGAKRVIIAHADLPLATDLRPMLSDQQISIAPDRHRLGTNVLCLPASLPFEFAYGADSFETHCAIARDLDISPRIVEIPDLARDLDNPDDLRGLDSFTELIEQESS